MNFYPQHVFVLFVNPGAAGNEQKNVSLKKWYAMHFGSAAISISKYVEWRRGENNASRKIKL